MAGPARLPTTALRHIAQEKNKNDKVHKKNKRN